MKFSSSIFCLIALSISITLLHAVDAGSRFELGNQLYEEEKYAEAIETYRALADDAQFSADLFFNWGNAEYRLDEPGKAAVAYERALHFSPGHKEARQNLKVIESRFGRMEFVEPMWAAVVNWFPRVTWPVLVSIGAWLVVLSAILWFGFRKSRRLIPWLVVVAVLDFFLGGLGWRASESLDKKRENLAVCLVKPMAVLRGEVSPLGSEIIDVPVGSQLRIIAERGPWTYVEVPTEELRGWLRSEELVRVWPLEGKS